MYEYWIDKTIYVHVHHKNMQISQDKLSQSVRDDEASVCGR